MLSKYMNYLLLKRGMRWSTNRGRWSLSRHIRYFHPDTEPQAQSRDSEINKVRVVETKTWIVCLCSNIFFKESWFFAIFRLLPHSETKFDANLQVCNYKFDCSSGLYIESQFSQMETARFHIDSSDPSDRIRETACNIWI